EVRAIDQIVVHERRHVHELDRDAGCERRLAARWSREEEEQRPQPLAARGERLVPRGRDEAGMARDRTRQTLLERVEILLEALGLADRRKRHRASPTCRATIPPANVLYRTRSKPQRSRSAASSAGGGKRRTLAGRYVYAEPPGSTLPSAGTTRSNHTR